MTLNHSRVNRGLNFYTLTLDPTVDGGNRLLRLFRLDNLFFWSSVFLFLLHLLTSLSGTLGFSPDVLGERPRVRENQVNIKGGIETPWGTGEPDIVGKDKSVSPEDNSGLFGIDSGVSSLEPLPDQLEKVNVHSPNSRSPHTAPREATPVRS